MSKRNHNFEKLKAGYLFPEVNKRKMAFLERNPDAQLISLGIGNTTLPFTPYITEKLVECASGMGTEEGYSGYSPGIGYPDIRNKIAEVLYLNMVGADEVFISDGAKCDIGRMQFLFDNDSTVALQDPAYPVYKDTSILSGKKEITLLPCKPENDFFPELNKPADILYFCSPNNPTGAVATRAQLERLVAFAKENQSIIIFDTAYACFIEDSSFPKSIYEIPGAREVAIEMGSFSKMAGFTGVRLSWTIVPKELKFKNGNSVRDDWSRILCTFFNGASLLAQQTAMAVLEPQGLKEIQSTIDIYKQNAIALKKPFEGRYKVYGSANSPYLWIDFGKRDSWEVFDEILEKTHLITTPGSGFGPSGEGFIRLSAFATPSNIAEAAKRLSDYFQLQKAELR